MAKRDLHSLLKDKVSGRCEELERNVNIITLTQNWWTEEWILQKHLKH